LDHQNELHITLFDLKMRPISRLASPVGRKPAIVRVEIPEQPRTRCLPNVPSGSRVAQGVPKRDWSDNSLGYQAELRAIEVCRQIPRGSAIGRALVNRSSHRATGSRRRRRRLGRVDDRAAVDPARSRGSTKTPPAPTAGSGSRLSSGTADRTPFMGPLGGLVSHQNHILAILCWSVVCDSEKIGSSGDSSTEL
jgi:hypothetical protein